MTKIPSVKERVSKAFQEVMEDVGKYYIVSDSLSDALSDSLSERLTQALTADRTAVLTELRDSELLKDLQSYDSWGDGHNTLARAIKARINNLINPTGV